MAIEVICKVLPGGLRVVNSAEATKLEHLLGKEVSARIYIPRNLKFHRKFFAMLNTAFDMSDFRINDQPGNKEQYRTHVTVGAGWCDFHKYGDKFVAVPRSIEFAKMDEAEFERLYHDCLSFICANYVVEETPETLDQMMQFM